MIFRPDQFFRVRRRAVTLLETALAMGLLVVLSSMTYWFYSSALQTRDVETEHARRLRLARTTLQRIAEEVRQTSVLTNGGQVGIVGETEAISISTLSVPEKNFIPGGVSLAGMPTHQTDLVTVEYSIARHPDVLHDDEGYELPLGLVRVERKLPRIDRGQGINRSAETSALLEQVEDEFGFGGDVESDEFGDAEGEPDVGMDINWQELYAPEIKFMRFCYFDGTTWWDSWRVQGENPLPQLVHITVGFEGGAPFGEEFGSQEDQEYCECMNRDPRDCEPQPSDRISTVVRVPQADPLFRSRISRETQAVMDELAVEGSEEGAP